MDGRDRQERPGREAREVLDGSFSFPVAPSHYDRMLAAAHALSLDMLANTATAPVIDADNCADWLAGDFARDRRAMPRLERRSPGRDRRRKPDTWG